MGTNPPDFTKRMISSLVGNPELNLAIVTLGGGRCYKVFCVSKLNIPQKPSPTAKFRRSAVSLLFPRSQTSFFFGDMAFSWESLGDQKAFRNTLQCHGSSCVYQEFFRKKSCVRPFWTSAFQYSFWNLYFWKRTPVDRVELGRTFSFFRWGNIHFGSGFALCRVS